MVCGTTSNAGKTTLVTGLCRLLARRGVRVAPFKAQNMALNSVVTPAGHEIGRAQAVQAVAAGLEPEVAMNPILLKPTGDRTSQVVVMGRPVGDDDRRRVPRSASPSSSAWSSTRWPTCARRFDVVLCEGAGSPAEINLLDHDIVNLRVAHEAGLPAIVVGDIDLGGVFAALYGTVGPAARALPRAGPGLRHQQAAGRSRPAAGRLRRSSSDALRGPDARRAALVPTVWRSTPRTRWPCAAPAAPPPARPWPTRSTSPSSRFPRISNFTDLDPLGPSPAWTCGSSTTPPAWAAPTS